MAKHSGQVQARGSSRAVSINIKNSRCCQPAMVTAGLGPSMAGRTDLKKKDERMPCIALFTTCTRTHASHHMTTAAF